MNLQCKFFKNFADFFIYDDEFNCLFYALDVPYFAYEFASRTLCGETLYTFTMRSPVFVCFYISLDVLNSYNQQFAAHQLSTETVDN